MMSPQDAERIHETSLRLLADPGVRVEHDAIRGLLVRAGAVGGHGANVVRFPREMVAERLALAPKTVRLASLDGSLAEVRAGAPSRFWTGAALCYLDLDGSIREITSADLAAFARLVDAFGDVHAVVGTALADVPPHARDFAGFRVLAENCRKHLRALSFTPAGAEAMKEMARALCGGSIRNSPVFSVGFTAHGPLRWTHLALDTFLRSAGDGIPVMVNGEPTGGASGPVTLAGNLAVGHAEVLAGIVINQVIEPGRPVIHNLGFSHVMDMRTATVVTGGAEVCLLAEAGAAIAGLLGLPSASWMCTDALVPDEQAALETTLAAVIHARAGVGIIWGVGSLESEKTLSPVKAVLDREIIGIVRRYLRGIEVTEDALAEEVIRDAGIAGDFLATEHTLHHFRRELYEPKILNRARRERWIADGAKRLTERARDEAAALLAAERPPLLDDAVARELHRIETHYRNKEEAA